MGCPLGIIILAWGYRQWGRSHNKKAQNDVRLASKVGLRVTPGIVRCQLILIATEGVCRPSLRERVDL